MINKEKLKELKIDIEVLEQKKAELSALKSQFEADNKLLIEYIKNLSNCVEASKNDLSEEAKKEFEETNKKSLTGGLGIRESKEITYDETKALEWAKEKDLFLILDKKGFEKAASSMKLDFVTETKKIGVTFPKEILL